MRREGGWDARGSSSSSWSRALAAAGADTLRVHRSNRLCEKLTGAFFTTKAGAADGLGLVRRVMVVADDASTGERLRLVFCDARTIAVVAHSDEAVERLGMGEACDLVVVANDDPACADLRERLAEVAPDVVMRIFEVRLDRGLDRGAEAADPSSSGLWEIVAR